MTPTARASRGFSDLSLESALFGKPLARGGGEGHTPSSTIPKPAARSQPVKSQQPAVKTVAPGALRDGSCQSGLPLPGDLSR